MRTKPATVIVPVYGDWPSLKQCIASLKENVDTSLHKVMLVNDCGPDADKIEQNIQHAIKDTPGFEYHRNPHNLGFVKTCNRAALELDKTGNDILLLNSDTVVTPGFLDEMLDVLYASGKIGAVSPRSNNATIATIPVQAVRSGGVSAKRSYKIFRKISGHLPRYTVVPVAHGFCMLIRRSVIQKYGLFDEIFGKGYGEEADFCMRIRQHGFSSALANRAYVFHLEARSFTKPAKAKLIAQHEKIILSRHPTYHQQIGNYLRQAIQEEKRLYLYKSLRKRLFAKLKIRG